METEDRRSSALHAGKKRSVKDRLGYHTRRHKDRRSSKDQEIDDMSIPQPGVPRTVPDIDETRLLTGTDADIGQDLAAKLCEPKTELMIGVVELVGRGVVQELFKETQVKHLILNRAPNSNPLWPCRSLKCKEA